MRTYEYKKYLKAKKINIHQMDDIINSELNEMEKFFSISFKETFEYVIARRNYKQKFKIKKRESDKAFENFNNYFETNQKDLLDPNIPWNEKELEAIIDRVGLAIENCWTDEDKRAVTEIVNSYYTLNIKNNLSMKISNKLLNNDLAKSTVQLIIFLFSFFVSYWINLKFEFLNIELGPFWSQFTVAIIFFLPLEMLLDCVKEELLYWRVKKLHYSYASLIPVIESAKDILKKNSC